MIKAGPYLISNYSAMLLKILKDTLAARGLHLVLTSDLSAGYIRRQNGDARIWMAKSKKGDCIGVHFPGEDKDYYLGGGIDKAAAWIAFHASALTTEAAILTEDDSSALVAVCRHDAVCHKLVGTHTFRAADKRLKSTEIPRVTRVETPEDIEMSKEAKRLLKPFYVPGEYCSPNDYFDTVDSLWALVYRGCLTAANMLRELAGGVTLAGKNRWPIDVTDIRTRYLVTERVLWLGGMVSAFELYAPDGTINIDKRTLNDIANLGCGLAMINLADFYIGRGGNIDTATSLYLGAAEKGYSVGWRALYCLYRFKGESEEAFDALTNFTESAQNDKTNWQNFEVEFSMWRRMPFSVLSANPAKAANFLKKLTSKKPTIRHI